ncbi:TonB-dependent receptor [Novosphingobium sp. Gsoil 351]|uniref:TonB-dependent receptor n=1 Tax=Novosphingobium sp. Gsoil 351 TaxID=2675225 RepID=UPI0012B4E56B|nr:TonB-dependent receptor [Novosphingobium sp. Gsoil 351]QGN53988.1 TonB-dependent receptor plug domain-containing protein [Novosphingobium sp. Gsoil 351]
MRLTTVLALPLAAMPFAAHGQEAADPSAPIVVTGRGLEETPATPAYDVTVLTREVLTRAASGRIEDVLSSVAGFQQFRRSDSRSSNPSAQGVTLRALGGNATSRSLVLLDGVPMADPFFGYIPLSALAPERLAAVRVTRGGGSGAFGAGAVAGTIELDSAGAGELGLASGEALVDDRGETEVSATLAPRLGRGFAVVSARWDQGDGFWTTPKAQRVAASARARFDSWSAGLRLVAPLSDTIELQARGIGFDDQRTLRFKDGDTASSGQDASLRVVGRGRWQFDALGYVQARDFSNIVISSTSFRKTLDQRRTPSTGLGGKLEVRPPLGDDHVARVGIDYRRASGGLQEEAYSAVTGLVTARRRAGGKNGDLGLFAQDDWTPQFFGGSLVLTGGVRADRWTIRDGYFRERNAAGAATIASTFANRSGWDVSVRGGAVAKLGGGVQLRGAGYTGLRLPTLNELYRPFVVFPVTTRANAALRNERLRGFEGGIDFTPMPALTLSATAFDNRVRNAIANVTIATNVRERRNVAAVHARGIELGAQARLGAFAFDGSLALTDAEVEANGASAALDGKRPAQTPKIAGSATLSWQPATNWRLATTLRRTGRQFEDDLEIDALPATTTLDAFAQVPLTRGFSLVLRGENLTGERIVTRNQAGSIDLGVPRTLWAGIRLGG